MKKLTKEIFQERSNKIHNSKYEIIGNYVNNKTALEIRHKICNNTSITSPKVHLKGSGGCNSCFKSFKKTNSELQNKSNEIHNNEYLILGQYISTDSNILIRHKICGYEFYQIPYNHINGSKCPKCSHTKRITTKEFQEESNKIHNNEYIVLGEYIQSHSKIEIRHKNCNESFKVKPNNHMNGSRCPHCYGKFRKTNIEFQSDSDDIYKNQYKLISDYISSTKKVKLIHLKCGKEFEIVAGYHLFGGGQCNCEMINLSKGEFIISNVLKEKNIEYHYNKSLGCRSVKELRFDFYLPKYNMCIEFDGEQHFKSKKWFGGESAFNYRKKLDNIKDIWCRENNIDLIRISYKENILNKLNNIFNI